MGAMFVSCYKSSSGTVDGFDGEIDLQYWNLHFGLLIGVLAGHLKFQDLLWGQNRPID